MTAVCDEKTVVGDKALYFLSKKTIYITGERSEDIYGRKSYEKFYGRYDE